MLVREREDNQARPVLAPAEPWRCDRCGRSLGILYGLSVEIRHEGRVILASLPCSQTCDRCTRVNRKEVDQS